MIDSIDDRSAERKHNEQVKVMQTEHEQEREQMMQQSARQRARLEHEIQALKEDETQLKDKLILSQKVRGYVYLSTSTQWSIPT